MDIFYDICGFGKKGMECFGKYFILFVTFFYVQTYSLRAQVADRILAIVDKEVILESDLESQVEYLKKTEEIDDEHAIRCLVFENLLTNKLLLAKARLDSLKVSDEQVENEVNRRLSILVMQAGGESNFEQITKKSVLQFKIELRPKILEQMLIEQQKSKITENIKVTPKEVQVFFEQIPKDSLPYLPAEVEAYKIIVYPKASEESKQAAKLKIQDIRKQILGGSSFEDLAKFYSQDYESAKQGGYLGEFKKGQMVPEFEEVAFSLKENEISEVFETSYGYHIIKLHKILGDHCKASHILIVPEKGPQDEQKALERLKQIRQEIMDSLKFEVAASRYSEDAQSKMYGGMILNPSTGEPRVPIDQLDPEIYLTIDKMKEGDISEPKEFLPKNPSLSKGYQIIYLKKIYPPHKASLENDYGKFKQLTLQNKQMEALEKWFKKAKEQVYIEIKDSSCKQALENWQ